MLPIDELELLYLEELLRQLELRELLEILELDTDDDGVEELLDFDE